MNSTGKIWLATTLFIMAFLVMIAKRSEQGLLAVNQFIVVVIMLAIPASVIWFIYWLIKSAVKSGIESANPRNREDRK